MSATDLHNFQQAMKKAKDKEIKEARDHSYRIQENERRRTFVSGTRSALEAKPVEPGHIEALEDVLIQSVREFNIMSPTMSPLAKGTAVSKINESSKKLAKMHDQRAYYETSNSLLNSKPQASKDSFGEFGSAIDGLITTAYSRRQEDALPKFNTEGIVNSLNAIQNLAHDAEAPADWVDPTA